MNYYSDPTASMALGNINREFARLEKKAKKLYKRLENGTISDTELKKEQAQFKGIYQHVLTIVIKKEQEKSQK